MNLSAKNKFQLHCEEIDGSVLNFFQKPIRYSFTPDSPPCSKSFF